MSRTTPSIRDGDRTPAATLRVPPALVVILAGVVAALHVGKMPPAIPVLRDALGVTLVEAGFLLSTVQLAGMLGGVFIGLAADGFGLRRSVLLGHAVLACASFAGVWVTRPYELLALRALEGCGFLLAVLPVPSLIRQLVPLRRLALHLGLWGSYMPAGTAMALAGGPLLMAAIGWRGLWMLLAMASAAVAGWVFLRVPADDVRRAAAGTGLPPPAPARGPWLARLRATLGCAGPWRVAITFAFYSSQWLAVIGFLPAVYAQAGLSIELAGLLTACASLANVIGNVAAGRLLHRGVSARHILWAGFIVMAATSFAAFSPFVGAAPVTRYLAVVLFSMIGGLIPATLFALAVEVAPSEQTVSTTVGWMHQCSSAGQFLGPPVVAWVAGVVGGWQLTWVLTGLASAAGLLLASGLRQRDP